MKKEPSDITGFNPEKISRETSLSAIKQELLSSADALHDEIGRAEDLKFFSPEVIAYFQVKIDQYCMTFGVSADDFWQEINAWIDSSNHQSQAVLRRLEQAIRIPSH
ncbi:MAG: hypothetical protein HY918_03050 [Candidatus Doudnabacteria bacterium]|nr:hypothetical protein [Candidatus Doudnabacteria bacterium]